MAENENPQSNLPFAIQMQYVKDISFENPNPIAVFSDESDVDPAINIDIQAKANPINDEAFEVVLNISANAQRGENPMYVAELSYGAIVAVAKDIPQDVLGQILMVYIPNLMFPFARNIIADLTRDGGYMPLMLSPVDFMALYAQQAEQQEAKAASA